MYRCEPMRHRAILAILALALAVRIFGIDFDAHHFFHPDERAIADADSPALLPSSSSRPRVLRLRLLPLLRHEGGHLVALAPRTLVRELRRDDSRGSAPFGPLGDGHGPSPRPRHAPAIRGARRPSRRPPPRPRRPPHPELALRDERRRARFPDSPRARSLRPVLGGGTSGPPSFRRGRRGACSRDEDERGAARPPGRRGAPPPPSDRPQAGTRGPPRPRRRGHRARRLRSRPAVRPPRLRPLLARRPRAEPDGPARRPAPLHEPVHRNAGASSTRRRSWSSGARAPSSASRRSGASSGFSAGSGGSPRSRSSSSRGPSRTSSSPSPSR